MDAAVLGLIRIAAIALAAAVLFLAAGLAWNHPPLFTAPGPLARLGAYLTRHEIETGTPGWPELAPRIYEAAPAAVYEAARSASVALGWRIEAEDPAAGRLHAVAITPVWRFRDDVWITVEPAGEGRSRLHVRARSRVGRGDLGANLRHYLDLVRLLEKRLGA